MKRILLLLLIPVLATSCNQEFLERTPVVGATEANFYKTPEAPCPPPSPATTRCSRR